MVRIKAEFFWIEEEKRVEMIQFTLSERAVSGLI